MLDESQNKKLHMHADKSTYRATYDSSENLLRAPPAGIGPVRKLVETLLQENS
jgi:hypothetical protein